MAKLTPKQRSRIEDLYRQGNSGRQIELQIGHSRTTIYKVLREEGINRSVSESIRLGRSNGSIVTSEATRQKLRESAKRAIRRKGKIWTKPERIFRDILNQIGLGVQFPQYAKEIFDLEDDKTPVICFQYPIQRYVCDFVDVKKKIVFQVNGDFWHGNPMLYDVDSLTDIQRHNIRQDKNRITYLKSRSWTICDIWESEIYWNQNLVKERVRAARELENPPVLHTGVARIVTEVAQLDWSDELRKLWFKEPRKKETEEITCKQCGTKFKVSKHNKRDLNRQYCGNECAQIPRRKVERPSKTRLKKEIAQNNWRALGKIYGVSDNAVRKWAKQYKLI